MPKKSESQLILEFNQKHNSYYTYDFSNYVNNKSKIKISCKEGHTFMMSISQHLKGGICPICSGNKCSKEDILIDCLKIHNNKFDYSKSDWKNLADRITIICPEHGEFKQELRVHRKGHSCPKCSRRYNLTNDEFIELCKSIEPSIIFTITKFKNVNTSVKFICDTHGIIEYLPMQIKKRNYICHRCYENSLNFKKFKEFCNEKWSNRYDYSLSKYMGSNVKIKIIDKERGTIFEQTPIKHKKHDYFYNKRTLSNFAIRSSEKHNNKYDYTGSIYLGNKTKLGIVCPVHGSFEQIPNNHLRGAGCPKCNRFEIKQTELLNFIKSIYTDSIIENDRNILGGKELDIYLPKLNLAFEFNGLYWHSEVYKDKNYHLNKLELCEKNNIRLFNIWEDDWNNKQEILKSMISNHIIGSNKIWARKCKIKKLDNYQYVNFLNENHLQGSVYAKVKVGLFYNDELVSVASFGTLRKSLGQNAINDSYELLRFCNKLNYSVTGGASRLISWFKEEYKPTLLISYANRDWSIGNLYESIGFKFISNSTPSYHYVISNKRQHRFNWRKDKLVKMGCDPSKTEHQIMIDNGYYRIWNCGTKKYEIR